MTVGMGSGTAFLSSVLTKCRTPWRRPPLARSLHSTRTNSKHQKNDNNDYQTACRSRACQARTGRGKTVGGIIIPDTAQEKPSRGAVVAVGQGTKDETMVLKAGDNVLYGKYAGTEVEIDGEKLLIMRQSDVLAVVE